MSDARIAGLVASKLVDCDCDGGGMAGIPLAINETGLHGRDEPNIEWHDRDCPKVVAWVRAQARAAEPEP